MLYVFYGTDTTKVADKAHNLVASLKKRKPDALVFTVEESNFNAGTVDELIDARGLFLEKHIIHIKTSFETVEFQEHILERLPKFASTQNVVVLSLGKVLSEHKKQLEHHAEKIEEHTTSSVKKEHNVFSVSDALGVRNPRKLWTEYMRARRADVPPQAIHGTLLWAVRGMVAASRSNGATDAGLKPSMYAKFKQQSGRYSEGELRTMLRDLLRLYHDSFRGRHDLDVALERWTLSI